MSVPKLRVDIKPGLNSSAVAPSLLPASVGCSVRCRAVSRAPPHGWVGCLLARLRLSNDYILKWAGIMPFINITRTAPTLHIYLHHAGCNAILIGAARLQAVQDDKPGIREACGEVP